MIDWLEEQKSSSTPLIDAPALEEMGDSSTVTPDFDELVQLQEIFSGQFLGQRDEPQLLVPTGTDEVRTNWDSASSEAPSPSSRTVREENTRRTFLLALFNALETEPVEDGIDHPVDDILARVLETNPQHVPGWIQEAYLKLSDRPSQAAGLIQCVGRLPLRRLGSYGATLVIAALNHRSFMVREAAVSAIEHWEDPKLIAELADHREPVTWVKEYITQVIDDLTTN